MEMKAKTKVPHDDNEAKTKSCCSQVTPKKMKGDNNNKPNRNHGTKPLIKQFTSNTKKREKDYMPTKRNKRSMTVIPRFLKAWSTSHAFCYSKTRKTPAPFLYLFSDPLLLRSSLFLPLPSFFFPASILSLKPLPAFLFIPQQAWRLQPPAWPSMPLVVSTRLVSYRKGVPHTSKNIMKMNEKRNENSSPGPHHNRGLHRHKKKTNKYTKIAYHPCNYKILGLHWVVLESKYFEFQASHSRLKMVKKKKKKS